MFTQAAAMEIGRSDELENFDMRVLWFLAGILDEENWVDIHHEGLARRMSTENHTIYRPNVTKALGRLVAAGILLKGPERTYRLNPHVGWKGYSGPQDRAKKAHKRGELSVVRP